MISNKILSLMDVLLRCSTRFVHPKKHLFLNGASAALHRSAKARQPLGVVKHLKDEEAMALPSGAQRKIWEVIEFRSDGTVLETWKTPEVLNLHPRDSHLFSASPVGAKTRAMITPRPGAILFRTEAAKACIFPDKAILFPCKVFQDTIRAAQAIKTAISQQKALPFEMRVLEALLFETHRSFDSKAKRLSMVADTVITDVSKGIPATASDLQRFLPINRKLTEMQYDVKETIDAINDVMNDEDQLFQICLHDREKIISEIFSRKTKNPDVDETGKPMNITATQQHLQERLNHSEEEKYTLNGYEANDINLGDDSSSKANLHDRLLNESSRRSKRSVEIRMASRILEAYEHQLLSVQGHLNECLESLETTRHVWNMSLDHNRNRILRVNLLISIASLAGLVSSIPAAYFGMNLDSGLENIPGIFWPVVQTSMATGGVVAASMYGYYKFGPKRRYNARMRDMQSLKDLLAFHLDYIDPIIDAVKDRKASNKKEFTIAVREAVPTISTEEIDLLFRVFDQNKNGLLELSELMRVEELHGQLEKSFLDHHMT